LQLTPYNYKPTTIICENSFDTSRDSKFYNEKQRKNIIIDPSCYQREFQYKTYLNTVNKIKGNCKQLLNSQPLVKEPSIPVSYEISFLHGSARFKDNHHKKYQRLIINNQFQFDKRNFQVWIAQIIDLSSLDKFLRVSSNSAATLICLQQSLMFKYFLPPQNEC